jgi:hypothetical protein
MSCKQGEILNFKALSRRKEGEIQGDAEVEVEEEEKKDKQGNV